MSRAMQSMWVSLKSGSWLTPERLRLYPALLLDFEAVAVLVLVVTSDGRHDFIGRPLGTDFAQVWVAGTEVLGGHPAQPFDVQAHLGAQRVFFGPATDVYGWHYPPYFLALGALLALLPYGAAPRYALSGRSSPRAARQRPLGSRPSSSPRSPSPPSSST
jgi:alpha-1,2-mannosyltransferase